ncbi:MAG: hypothetical protein KJN96_11265, partial [Eudoraea sp.]|nr:hypothetical protein [Eudoraea sp.]
MKQNYILQFSNLASVLIFACLALQVGTLSLTAQTQPFNCDYSAFLFQYNDIYALDLASGSSYLVKEDITPGSINAAAYNSADGYLWGYLSTPTKSIVRIGKNYTTDTFSIPDLPDQNNKYVGEISINGIYYVKGGGSTYYSIDLNPSSPNYLKFLDSHTLSKNIKIHDWAFNAADGKLYTLEKGTNHLYRITADTGDVEDLGEVPILSGFNYTYGAVYFDVDGNFYVSANQTGSVYKISRVQEVQSGIMTSNIFAFGPSSSSNDGARCPTAPVLQEDCSNGIDDDGDGLIDCDDPACSGISSCPTITTTSGANKGGLESNDRLAQLISNRNYKRVKDNYIFDKAQAKKVTKDNNYKKRAIFSKTQLPLSSFVPLGVIGETTTIESSPKDLLDLTNASDIFSVDYLRDMETVSALMVIKTEEQVYEHSKFICDRFLGASLLSVSTIEIRGQKFIKSIIKQPDGSIEFALSFSARLNKENQYIIESHWNMDAFTANSMYYNFQIWSNTIDDLFVLGEEILSLLEVQGPIAGFRNSDPPPVFVKTARYHRGAVQLEIVNTNESNNISIAGGLKKTETAITESLGVELALSGYTDYVTIETGALFDLGFRINPDNAGTPDDLFVADAPWGLDASSASTSITRFSVTQNDSSYDEEVHAVERNIVLEGTTREYLGVYRAFNPRFLAVDLSAFNSLSFDASGTGTLEVVLLKSGGSKFYTEVVLANDQKTFSIKDSDFRGVDGQSTDFSELKVVLFNMKSENGTTQYKRLLLSKVFFEDAIIQESEVFVTNRESI